jgi:hypothetical protein
VPPLAAIDMTTVLVALLGGGFVSGVTALLKFKPEKDAVVVSAAQGAVVVQSGVIDALQEELHVRGPSGIKSDRCAWRPRRRFGIWTRGCNVAEIRLVPRRDVMPLPGDTLVTLTVEPGEHPLEERVHLLGYAFIKAVQGTMLKQVLRYDLIEGCIQFVVAGDANPPVRGAVHASWRTGHRTDSPEHRGKSGGIDGSSATLDRVSLGATLAGRARLTASVDMWELDPESGRRSLVRTSRPCIHCGLPLVGPPVMVERDVHAPDTQRFEVHLGCSTTRSSPTSRWTT